MSLLYRTLANKSSRSLVYHQMMHRLRRHDVFATLKMMLCHYVPQWCDVCPCAESTHHCAATSLGKAYIICRRQTSLKKALASASAFFLVRDVLALILLLSISYLLLCSWRRFARLRRLSSHITACLRNQRTSCVFAPTKKTDTKLCPPFCWCEMWDLNSHGLPHAP